MYKRNLGFFSGNFNQFFLISDEGHSKFDQVFFTVCSCQLNTNNGVFFNTSGFNSYL